MKDLNPAQQLEELNRISNYSKSKPKKEHRQSNNQNVEVEL